MEKQTWWKEAVVYQIYPRSFMDSNGDGIGDLQGVISKLDYLVDLGIDVIWLSPVYQSPNVDMGYDISDYQSIMDEFGKIGDMIELLNEAHKRNIKIVMDLVVNHTSDQHPWFIESKKSKDNPYRDYYIWKSSEDGEPTNWGAFFNGSAWKYDEITNEYYLHLYTEQQPDLNWDHQPVRQSIHEMMEWWCDLGVDGFRMDVINLISKPENYVDHPIPKGHKYATTRKIIPNGPKVHDYIREIHDKVLAKRDLITVGETPGGTTEEAVKYAGFDRRELQMIFQFEHMEVDDDPEFGRWTDKKLDLVKLKKVMTKWQTELEGKAWNSLYWSNHDQSRIVSRWGNDSPEYRELSAKMLGTCLHFLKGTPYIYQGEELGMTNSSIQGLDEVRDVSVLNAYKELVVEQKLIAKEKFFDYVNRRGRDNARTPMQWNGSAYGGFSTNQPWIRVNPSFEEINAESQVNDPNSVFNYYKNLIKLRHHNKTMVYGTYQLLEESNEKLFVYTRSYEEDRLLVICNFTDEEVEYAGFDNRITYELILNNYKGDTYEVIRPYEAKVYRIIN